VGLLHIDNISTTNNHSRGREPLRIRLPPQLPHAHPPSRPDRDDVTDPLRVVPRQAAARPQGELRRRRPRLATHLTSGRPRAQQEQPAHDDERVLGLPESQSCGQRGGQVGGSWSEGESHH
jgi:hypothetical protein